MAPFYVTDLDGTLLRNAAFLSDYSRDTLNRLIEEGLAFTAASARSIFSMQGVLQGLRLRLPVIEFNGAYITELESGRHLVVNAIERDILEDLYAAIQEAGCAPFIMTYDGERDYLYYHEPTHEGMVDYMQGRIEAGDKRLTPVGDIAAMLGQQVVCLNVVDRPEVLGELEVALRRRYPKHLEIHLFENIYLPGWYWLMIQEKTAAKDRAIQTLMEGWHLQGHELVVFGDNDNDIAMFRIADRAIAVGNAIEALKEHATEVIEENETDSVVRYIEADWQANGER